MILDSDDLCRLCEEAVRRGQHCESGGAWWLSQRSEVGRLSQGLAFLFKGTGLARACGQLFMGAWHQAWFHLPCSHALGPPEDHGLSSSLCTAPILCVGLTHVSIRSNGKINSYNH